MQNPKPTRTITEELTEVGAVAVDPSGDVYVANGRAGNVLEFAPGGTALVRTYSMGLHHPTSVAVARGTLYVADQAGQVIEYSLGNNAPLAAIDGPRYYSQPNSGIAFGPSDGSGSFFVSASSLSAIPFVRACAGSTYTVAENLLPTLWRIIPLSNNQQAAGLAFDATGKLFVSDPCANDVAIYSDINYTWTYTGKVPGIFDAPLFLTINHQLLAVPSDGTRSASGNVMVIDLTGEVPTVTISNGLQHPVGAAAILAPQIRSTQRCGHFVVARVV